MARAASSSQLWRKRQPASGDRRRSQQPPPIQHELQILTAFRDTMLARSGQQNWTKALASWTCPTDPANSVGGACDPCSQEASAGRGLGRRCSTQLAWIARQLLVVLKGFSKRGAEMMKRRAAKC